MMCRGKAIVGLVVAVVWLLSGSLAAWSAAIVKDGDSNTIGEAIAKPDGSIVTLTCEQVLWRGKSGKSFAIKEWFEKTPDQPRILVVSTQPLPVEDWWSVDVTGTLSTFTGSLQDGTPVEQRVLILAPTDVFVHCDSKGRPIRCGGFKGFEIGGITKRSLAEFATQNNFSTAIAGLPTIPDNPDPLPPLPGSRDSICSLPDGARVSINGAVVSGSIDGRFAIERGDRSFGIWMHYPGKMPERALVDVTGRMSTEDGSRTVVADSVTILDTEYPEPSPLGMNNRHLHYGLDTSGRLVRVWGKVTAVDSNNRIFFIDDGSCLDGGSGNIGVKIYDYTNDGLPSTDDFVAVNGTSGAENPDIRNVTKTTSPTTIYETSLMQMQSGSGTISGKITAAGANGSSVRVYCGSASTKATFIGDTAHYTLNAPYGSHAVTVSIAGYKTTTKLVNVNSETSNPIQDMTLPALEKEIDIIATPAAVLADGSLEISITAIVRDEEGRRVSNTPISWNLSTGSLFAADSVTDVVGEAKAVVRCAPDANAIIKAQAGEVKATCSLD